MNLVSRVRYFKLNFLYKEILCGNADIVPFADLREIMTTTSSNVAAWCPGAREVFSRTQNRQSITVVSIAKVNRWAGDISALVS